MKTPLYDFLKQYIHHNSIRLHMPGHKGRLAAAPLAEAALYDITEVEGADALYEAEGVLRESEELAASLYESGLTLYSAGGSTLCIQTMISALCGPGDAILAARNAHHSLMNTCALLGVSPHWILPRYNDSFGVSGEVLPEQVEAGLIAHPEVKAVYLTSPDYLGCMSDVAGIARICRRHQKPLLVDNAHGAHLKFLREDCHPMTLGASLCCDSAHKTLPVLTGGSYLHVSRAFLEEHPELTRQALKGKMSLFGSTSPSYLILLSLDLCNPYLESRAGADFAQLEEIVASFYAPEGAPGIHPISRRTDPSKLTLDAFVLGMTGTELADFLRRSRIECEYVGARHVVLMLSPQNTSEETEYLRKVLENLPVRKAAPLSLELPPFTLPQKSMEPREACFAPKELVPVEKAVGRTAAETRIKCPPGVPIVVAGEIIGKDTQKILKNSGIPAINVIK